MCIKKDSRFCICCRTRTFISIGKKKKNLKIFLESYLGNLILRSWLLCLSWGFSWMHSYGVVDVRFLQEKQFTLRKECKNGKKKFKSIKSYVLVHSWPLSLEWLLIYRSHCSTWEQSFNNNRYSLASCIYWILWFQCIKSLMFVTFLCYSLHNACTFLRLKLSIKSLV